MAHEEKTTEERRKAQTLPGTVDVRRRRLVVGSASAPILLSIASRPAWGSACSPSALASANASGRHDYSDCANKSAGYWKKIERWPSTVRPDWLFEHRFGSKFIGPNGADANVDTELSLGQVINLTGSENEDRGWNGQTGLHVVGAYVNAYAFPGGTEPDFGYTPAQIVEIFKLGHVPNNLAAPGWPHNSDIVGFFEHINNRGFF